MSCVWLIKYGRNTLAWDCLWYYYGGIWWSAVWTVWCLKGLMMLWLGFWDNSAVVSSAASLVRTVRSIG